MNMTYIVVEVWVLNLIWGQWTHLCSDNFRARALALERLCKAKRGAQTCFATLGSVPWRYNNVWAARQGFPAGLGLNAMIDAPSLGRGQTVPNLEQQVS